MSRTKPSVIERKRTKTNESTNRTKPRPPQNPPPNTPVAHRRTKSYIKHTRYCIIGGYYISGTGAWRPGGVTSTYPTFLGRPVVSPLRSYLQPMEELHMKLAPNPSSKSLHPSQNGSSAATGRHSESRSVPHKPNQSNRSSFWGSGRDDQKLCVELGKVSVRGAGTNGLTWTGVHWSHHGEHGEPVSCCPRQGCLPCDGQSLRERGGVFS